MPSQPAFIEDFRPPRPVLSSQMTTIDDLPEDVLLEIFDAFRLETKARCRTTYDWQWGTLWGWFELSHVCQKWRSVILASPSRLDLHIFFRSGISPSALSCPWLPPLPISVWCINNNIRRNAGGAPVIRATQYPDRLREIDIGGLGMDKVFLAMNRAFPALEVLRVDAGRASTFFKVPAAPNLRVLSLKCVHLSPLSQLLSSATNLVDLQLWLIKSTNCLPPAILLGHLQSMHCLRDFKLGFTDIAYYDTSDDSIQSPISSKNAVAASELVSFWYRGDTAYLEELVPLLAPAPLEDYQISLFYGSEFAIPGLVRSIRAALAGRSCTVVEAIFGRDSSYLLLGDRSDPTSDPTDRLTPFGLDVSFEDVGERVVFMARIWGALVGSIAPVEELDLAFNSSIRSYEASENRIPWGVLLEHFCNVKKLKLASNIVSELAHFLCAGCGEPASGVLLALEEIELYHQRYTSVPTVTVDVFQPFVAARKLAARTVKVSITTDMRWAPSMGYLFE